MGFLIKQKWGLSLVAVSIIVAVTVYTDMNRLNRLPALIRQVALDPPRPLQAFSLIDHNREKVELSRFKEHWTLVFFGYTHCPDVCPATMAQLNLIDKNVGGREFNNFPLQIVFVSVDPRRDTPEHLAEYMNFFNKRFVALTGTELAIAAFEKQFGVSHRVDQRNKDGGYSMSHSAEIYLVDPQAMLAAKFLPPLNISRVVAQVTQLALLQDRARQQLSGL